MQLIEITPANRKRLPYKSIKQRSRPEPLQ